MDREYDILDYDEFKKYMELPAEERENLLEEKEKEVLEQRKKLGLVT